MAALDSIWDIPDGLTDRDTMRRRALIGQNRLTLAIIGSRFHRRKPRPRGLSVADVLRVRPEKRSLMVEDAFNTGLRYRCQQAKE